MALSASVTPLVISMTQGGADAFVQGSVLTGLSGRQAYNAKAVALSIPSASLVAVNAATLWSWYVTLTRRSKTAQPEISDNDVIFRWSLASQFTTSGAFTWAGDYYQVFPLDQPIVEETIYAQLDSDGVGTAFSAIVRIDVELDTISDIDRLNLITRSLT